MSVYQIAEILLLAVFYMAYIAKMLYQKKQGIQTAQLGKGSVENGVKDAKTFKVERFVSLMSYVMIAVLVISIITDWYWLRNDALRIAGLAIAVLGCLSFIAGMITLSDSWRAGIPDADETRLVYKGIYRVSRNPAFVGFDLIYIGSVLTFFNPVICAASILTMISLHLLILEEEKFLAKRFGVEYLEYKKKVGRYILLI